jgi:hypothetical protein
MSYDYFLVCMECKTGIHLGKTVYTKYEGVDQVTLGFDLLGSTSEHAWSPSAKNCTDLQHFLILHRTHELRVLPETVGKYASELSVPHSFPTFDDDPDPEYNRIAFLSQDPGKPDPVKEGDELPEDVIKKLRIF